MPKIKLDDIEYNTEDLTDKGKATLASLQFLEGQINKMRSELAVYQTAQSTYVAALKTEIDQSGIQPLKNKDLDDPGD